MKSILFKISMKFVPQSPIDGKSALIQEIVWHLIGDKPLCGPVMIQIHICIINILMVYCKTAVFSLLMYWRYYSPALNHRFVILENVFESVVCKISAILLRPHCVNSLAPGRFENNFQNVFFKLISWIDTLSNSCETVLRRMPQNPSDDKTTLVQVMAWCHQATSHYLT